MMLNCQTSLMICSVDKGRTVDDFYLDSRKDFDPVTCKILVDRLMRDRLDK